VTRLPFILPEGDATTPNDGMALSPDGTTLVYAGERDGVQQLFVRTRDQMAVRPLPGTEGARNPFFSPNGASVGFFAADALMRVALAGGPPATLCAVGTRRGATWGPDDTIVFASTDALGLMQVPAAGGEPHPLTEPEDGTTHLWPTFVPGGEAVLYTIGRSEGLNTFEVAVVSLDTGEQQTLVGGTDGAVTASGHLVFGREDSLWAVPFDADQLMVSGEPAPVVEGVQVNSGGWEQYALASDGTLVYRPATGGLRRSLVWVDRDGAQEPINVPSRGYTYARLSPDGRRIALDSRDDESDIWTWDVERETLQRLTRDPGMNRGPVWSPDGERIAFTAVRDGTESIHWQSADGSGVPEPLSAETSFPLGFTPDGSRLLFANTLGSVRDVGILDVDGSGPAELLLDQSFDEHNAQVSPAGRWLAYQSNESGQLEIYVRPFPDVNSALYTVSTGGGSRPRWSSAGDELFYYVDPGTIMAVPVNSGTELVLGSPEVAVQGAYARPLNSGTHYDVSPDGRRFLLIVEEEGPEGEATPPPMVVVLNWHQELLEQVPVP
jgi:serine/threonine-protein kinase